MAKKIAHKVRMYIQSQRYFQYCVNIFLLSQKWNSMRAVRTFSDLGAESKYLWAFTIPFVRLYRENNCEIIKTYFILFFAYSFLAPLGWSSGSILSSFNVPPATTTTPTQSPSSKPAVAVAASISVSGKATPYIDKDVSNAGRRFAGAPTTGGHAPLLYSLMAPRAHSDGDSVGGSSEKESGFKEDLEVTKVGGLWIEKVRGR